MIRSWQQTKMTEAKTQLRRFALERKEPHRFKGLKAKLSRDELRSWQTALRWLKL